MTLSDIDITATLKRAKELAASDSTLPSSVRTLLELLILIIELLVSRLNMNSRNSSTPPSQDPNRSRGKVARAERQQKRKPGGQPGHKGETIAPISNPDRIESISVDRRTIPRGHKYTRVEDEIRQVINIVIQREVIEYRAEVLVDEKGRRYRAEFPDGVTRPVQYGASVKAEALYLSAYQLLPNHRIQEFFRDQAGIELSVGSLHNFRKEAYQRLESFEDTARTKLRESPIAHFDETGINISGKLAWLHSASNHEWTLYGAHAQRGKAGIESLGVFPDFSGIACHDHWKPYLKYDCIHVLCNAHHTRELTGVIENEGYRWAHEMKKLLERTQLAVKKADGQLSQRSQSAFRAQYRRIINRGEKECPMAEGEPNKRGRTKQSKARNLLNRLRDFEEETLRFITNPLVPYTNNLAERDIRMAKLQQKISGCFKSIATAQMFCRTRGFISTCTKRNLSATQVLKDLFNGDLPDFLQPSS